MIKLFAHSPQNLPILSHTFNNGGPRVLILGGVHGDEIEGVQLAWGLLESFYHSFPYKLNLTVIPEFNIDGVLNKTRGNSNGYDLNRNLPTKDWSPVVKTPRYHPGLVAGSEPENKALVQFIETEKPKLIISLHSWFPVLNVNGDCLAEAEVLAKWTGYKIDADIGYPTPGCLGTFAGLERNCPTLTYEIERGLAAPEVLRIHRPAVLEALKVTEKK